MNLVVASVAWFLAASTWMAFRLVGFATFDSPIFGIMLVGVPTVYLTYLGLKRGLRADKVTEMYKMATVSQADNVDLRTRITLCEVERAALTVELAALKRKYLNDNPPVI